MSRNRNVVFGTLAALCAEHPERSWLLYLRDGEPTLGCVADHGEDAVGRPYVELFDGYRVYRPEVLQFLDEEQRAEVESYEPAELSVWMRF